jgi:hypothetical protein
MLLLIVKVRDPSLFSQYLPADTQLGANIASRLPEGFPLLIDGEGWTKRSPNSDHVLCLLHEAALDEPSKSKGGLVTAIFVE